MKNKLIIILFLMLVLSNKIFSFEGMQIKIDNYEITVPPEWLAKRADSDPNAVFYLYAPLDENGAIRENCNLTVEKLPADITIKELMQIVRIYLKTVYDNFTLIEEGDNYHIFSGELEGVSVQQIQFITISDRTAYSFTCTSTPEDFDCYLDIFIEIYNSFKF